MAQGRAAKRQEPSQKAISRAVKALTAGMAAEPEEYRISLRIVPDSWEIVGECALTIRLTKHCDRVPALLGRSLQVTGVSVEGSPTQSERAGDLLWISLGRMTRAGAQVKLAVRYRGRLPNAYVVPEGRSAWIELHPIAFWYPLVTWHWDFASVTPFRLECWLPDGLQAVSNGEAVGAADGRHTWESAGSPLIAMLAGPYATHRLGGEGYVVTCYGRPDMTEELRWLCEQVVLVSALFTRTYGPLPNERLDLVVPPVSVGGNWTLDDLVVAAQMRAGDPARNFAILTHELGHQWWGKGVQIDYSRDIWLAEGLTEFSGLRARYKVRGEAEVLNQLEEWTLPRYARARAAHTALAACRPESPASEQIREDASVVLLTQLRARLGSDEFDRRLRRFCRDHLGKKAGTPEFERVMLAGVSDEVREFVRQWVQDPDPPEVTAAEVLAGLR